jgi:hypothetical protein
VPRPRLTCDHCAGVIGVYEAIVAVLDGQARETSRALEPAIGSGDGQLYHRACHHDRAGKTPVRDPGQRTGVS